MARDDGAPPFPCAEQRCDQDETLGAYLDYQRVDGFVFGFAPQHLAESDFELSVQGLIGYGFESERWSAGQ